MNSGIISATGIKVALDAIQKNPVGVDLSLSAKGNGPS
jgi:hypothetical protein